MPNALLVYPEFPPSYWGYQFALEFIGKKASMPPLGLLTVAGMFPKEYDLKVVDMNVGALSDADLEWADLVLTSTMIVQKDSLYDVVRRCNRADVPIIAGGPHPTSYYDNIKAEAGGTVNHFLSGEVEEVFGDFLTDLKSGVAKEVYTETKKPDVTQTPIPRFDLINLQNYGSMALQFSRGCPFDCEFCDITKLFGRVPRTKSNEQMLSEFQFLHDLGWRGSLFLVDDNFIGNKRDAMRLLPEVAQWQNERDFPFALYTEASVNLADMEPLMDAMVAAGLNEVFLGIETPNPDALVKMKKKQNTKKGEDNYLVKAVRSIQEKGMEVMAGFILGLDDDTEDAFDTQIEFIQTVGIPRAMVGLLTVLKNTDLFFRLQKEGRLMGESDGNNVGFDSLNFKTEMDKQTLIDGYKRVLSTLYDPTLKNYFERCLSMFKHLKPVKHGSHSLGITELTALIKSIKRQLFSKQGPAYFRYLMKVIADHPKMFVPAVTLAIHGYHFEKITSQTVAVDNFKQSLKSESEAFEETVSRRTQGDRIAAVGTYAQALFARVQVQYEQIHHDFRHSVHDALVSFQASVFRQYLDAELRVFKETVSRFAKTQSDRIETIGARTHELIARVEAQYDRVHHDFRENLEDTLESFKLSVKSHLDQVGVPIALSV